jgi:hypothetical protein
MNSSIKVFLNDQTRDLNFPFRSDRLVKLYHSKFGVVWRKLFINYVSFIIKKKGSLVIRNSFPYDLYLKSIKKYNQFIVFYDTTITKPTISYTKNRLLISSKNKNKIIANVKDFVIWENPSSLKSIKHIEHFHLLVEY